jgi:methionine salvage enolase-phosphatase E1
MRQLRALESYADIARQMKTARFRIFISDTFTELNAAVSCGMQVALCALSGRSQAGNEDYPAAETLDVILP